MFTFVDLGFACFVSPDNPLAATAEPYHDKPSSANDCREFSYLATIQCEDDVPALR